MWALVNRDGQRQVFFTHFFFLFYTPVRRLDWRYPSESWREIDTTLKEPRSQYWTTRCSKVSDFWIHCKPSNRPLGSSLHLRSFRQPFRDWGENCLQWTARTTFALLCGCIMMRFSLPVGFSNQIWEVLLICDAGVRNSSAVIRSNL